MTTRLAVDSLGPAMALFTAKVPRIARPREKSSCFVTCPSRRFSIPSSVFLHTAEYCNYTPIKPSAHDPRQRGPALKSVRSSPPRLRQIREPDLVRIKIKGRINILQEPVRE